MTNHANKSLILFDEYKAGFEEIKKMVDGFEDINFDSQKVFLKERVNVFEFQMQTLKKQQIEVFVEVRSFLAETNSKLKALSDMENFLNEQFRECDEIKELLSAEGTGKNEGK